MKEAVKFITEFPSTDNCYNEEAWFRQHSNSIVVINCKSSRIYYPEHWTPLSIKCAFNGKEFYKFRNTKYSVGENNFLLLNEGNNYESYINSESLTESFTLNFTRENIKDLSAYALGSTAGILDDPFREASTVIRVFEKLYRHSEKTYSYINAIKSYYKNRRTEDQQLREILYMFLYELISLTVATSDKIDTIQAKRRTTREELYKRLHIAKDYIQSCYDQNITLEDLSRISFLNSFHLLREFKKYFLVTPHKYLTSVRLREAKILLEKTSLSIADIAGSVGFGDQSSFSKLFKNYAGKAPEFYRKDTACRC